MTKQEEIIASVASNYLLNVNVIMSRNRHKYVAQARQTCMFLFYIETDMSMTQIADYFSRNYQSVNHAIHKIASLIHDDKILEKLINKLKKNTAKLNRSSRCNKIYMRRSHITLSKEDFWELDRKGKIMWNNVCPTFKDKLVYIKNL